MGREGKNSDLSGGIECGPGSIALLLATYNGEKYIAEQLDSLLNQTVFNSPGGGEAQHFYP